MRINLFGASLDCLTLKQFGERIAELVASGGTHAVITLNPELLYRTRQDRPLLDMVNRAALVTPDGIGVVWAGRKLGYNIPERVAGIDLAVYLMGRASEEGWRVYFLGSAPGVAEEAAARARAQFPGLEICGTHHGYFGREDDAGVIANIKQAGPHLLFVAMGCPYQDEWIDRNRNALGDLVAIGVGGSLDVLAGRTARAPVLLQRLHLEWLGRLFMEPRRLRRMMVLPRFAWWVLKTYRSGKAARGIFLMPKVVISGYYGFKNNGDEAMLYAILQALDERVPGLEAVVLSRDPAETGRTFGVRAVPRHDLVSIIRELKKSDLLISGGGGLLQDVTGPNSIIYYLGIVALARFMKKPVFFYGQGIGPVRTFLGRTMMRLVANSVDLIAVRDEESGGELRNLGVVRPPVEVTADPALGINVGEIDPGLGSVLLSGLGIDFRQKLVGVSVRGWKGETRYKEVIARACDRLMEEGRRIIFLPMHYPGDVEVSREIAALMKEKPYLVEQQLNFREMLSLMLYTDLLVGMRLHFLIFGALLNVPVVGISYDPKVDRFLRLVDMPCGGSVKDIESDRLLECIDLAGGFTPQSRARLAGRVSILRREALRGADMAARFLERTPG